MRTVLMLCMLFFCIGFFAMAETVTVQPGDTAWEIHARLTGNGNDFRYSEYLRPLGQTGQSRTFFKSEDGKISRAELRKFRRLQPGDVVIIPEKIIGYKQVPGNNRTVEELCQALGSPAGCGTQIAAANNVTSANFRLNGPVLVPKNYQQATQVTAPPQVASTTVVTTSKKPACPDCFWPTVLAWVFGFSTIVSLVIAFLYKDSWWPADPFWRKWF